MTTTSRFRYQYWILLLFGYALVILLLIVLVYHSIKNGELDYKSFLFWSALLIFLGFLYYLRFFALNDIKKITVDKDGIQIKYPLKRTTEHIDFEQISKFRTSRISNHQFAGKKDGYQELEIVLKNDEFITFSAYQYENYDELRMCIYNYFKELENNDS